MSTEPEPPQERTGPAMPQVVECSLTYKVGLYKSLFCADVGQTGWTPNLSSVQHTCFIVLVLVGQNDFAGLST